MAQKPTPEFRAEAVRVALTSGLSRKQVAVDFGIGFSTLSRWIQQDRRTPEKPTVIPPFLRGLGRRIYAAIRSFWAGVIPPLPMLGRSLL